MSKVPVVAIISFIISGCGSEGFVVSTNDFAESYDAGDDLNNSYESKSGSGVHPAEQEQPGFCDPAYVVDYTDKQGNEHKLKIPSICGPEEIYTGDPAPPGVAKEFQEKL